MKNIIAVLTAFILLALLPGCAGVTAGPAAVTEEPAGDAATRNDIREETQPLPDETTEEPTDAPTEQAQGYFKPTDAVTYSDAGIPIANAYFSFRLPADWDGHYLCETSYDGDVLTLRFRHRESADAGMGGTLFLLALTPEGEDCSAASRRQLHTLSDGDETFTLWLVEPTDVQFSEETAQQYAAMRAQIDGALETLEPGAGCRF